MVCLHCDLSKIIEQTRPPDAELVDLIEQAFLEGQSDGPQADLAYAYLCIGAGNKYCMNIQYGADSGLPSKDIMWDFLWY